MGAGLGAQAPNTVALYLLDDGSCVVENFGDEPVNVKLGEVAMQVPARGWRYQCEQNASSR